MLQDIERKQQTSKWPWLLALLGIAAWAIISWFRNRELARLRHEAFVYRLQADQAKLEAELRANQEEQRAAQVRFQEVQRELLAVESEISHREQQYAKDLQSIRSIRSWRDAGIR